MVPAMTSSPAGVSPGPRPISRVAVRSAASRSARRTAPRSAASGPPGPVGQAGQRERAVRDALAVERGAQLADALGEQRRAEAGQPRARVPPRGGADREVADDDPAAADLGRRAAGQRDQRAAVARAEEHAAQGQPGGVAGEDADDVGAALAGHAAGRPRRARSSARGRDGRGRAAGRRRRCWPTRARRWPPGGTGGPRGGLRRLAGERDGGDARPARRGRGARRLGVGRVPVRRDVVDGAHGAALRRRDDGGAASSTPPPGPPRSPAGGGASPVNR